MINELQCDILVFFMNVAHIICVTRVEWHQTLASGSFSLRARLVLGCLITQNALYCIRPQGEGGRFKRFVFPLWHKYECSFLHWPVKRFALRLFSRHAAVNEKSTEILMAFLSFALLIELYPSQITFICSF